MWIVSLMLSFTVGTLPAGSPQQPAESPVMLQLELRAFDGTEEVTGETRLRVYRAGDRTSPLHEGPPSPGPIRLTVPSGMYDVQAIRERAGRVLGIRWALELPVLPYAEQRGRHLEIVNLRRGFGGLQLLWHDSPAPTGLAVFRASERAQEAAAPIVGDGYTLFVVPAGTYDLRAGDPSSPEWITGLDVREDRTLTRALTAP